MRHVMFAMAFVLTGAAASAQETRPSRPAQPGVQPRPVQPRPVQPNPWGRATTVTAARMMQLEEDVEALEAQRETRRAHVKIAEIGIRGAEIGLNNVKKLADRKLISQDELDKATLDVETAKAQLAVRQAELKEVEVKLKFAKKRLEDAKAAGVRPAPGVRPVPDGRTRPVDPNPNVRSTEREIIELKNKIDKLTADAEQSSGKLQRAAVALEVAQDNLTKLQELAKTVRLKVGTLEGAEAGVAAAQAEVAKIAAERKARDAEIDALRKKLGTVRE